MVEEGCTLEIRDSFIEEVGMPAFNVRPEWREISLYIGTPNATIENSTFSGGLAGPFFDEDVLAPPVRNCTFENVYGIISYGIGIEDCTFRNQNLFGVVFHGGNTGYVARCTFESVFATCVQVGYEYFEPYELHPAEANIIDCTFRESTRAIKVLDLSASVITDCTVDNMEREGIVVGVDALVHIYDGSVRNTFDAIFAEPSSRVDWTVTDEASVSDGRVRLTGNITVLEDARLDLVDIRNLTLLSINVEPLYINLHEGALLNLVRGTIEIPEPTAAPEYPVPVTLGPDPNDVRGVLQLDDVHRLEISDGYHIRGLRASNCTIPLGTAWVEELHLVDCTLVPDPRTDRVQLTVGGSDGRTDCTMVRCQLEGINRIPGDGAWLVVLHADVVSVDFLYDLGEMMEEGAVLPQGSASGPATFHVSWTGRARVIWQNQMPIDGTPVKVTSSLGTTYNSFTDSRGLTGYLEMVTEELTAMGEYLNHLPLRFEVNISGLEQGTSVDSVAGPIRLDLMVFDLIPPRLILDQGTEVSTNSTNFTLSGSVVDDHSGVLFLEVALLPADYIRVPLDPNTGMFEHMVVLGNGYQTISVRAYDAVGNRRGKLVDVFFSLSPPYVFIDEPLEGAWVNKELIFVAGITEVGATVDIQGRVNEAENGTFRIPAYLVEGPNLLVVNVTSLAGNHNSTSVLVYLDTGAPSLEVVYPPASPHHTKDVSHTIRGTAEPGSYVYVNQVPVDVDEFGTFVTNRVNLNEGSTQFTVRAVDEAGNENVTQVVFLLDSQPPTLVVLVDGEDAMKYTDEGLLRTSARSLTITVNTDEDAMLYLDGETVATEGNQAIIVHPLSEGLQSITLRVEDPAGNWLDFPAIRVEVDWSPPTLSLDEGMPNVTEVVLLSLKGETEPNCTVTVNGVRVAVDSEGGFFKNFLLNEGVNTLIIESTDRYGQTTQVTYSVTMVAPEPEPWPDAESLIPLMLGITVAVLVVEVVILHLYWRRKGRKQEKG